MIYLVCNLFIELLNLKYENGEDSKQVLSEILYKKKMAQYSNYLPEHRIFRQEVSCFILK